MVTEQQILALGKSVLAVVKSLEPKAQAAVAVLATHRAHPRFARNEITTAGENDELSVSLSV